MLSQKEHPVAWAMFVYELADAHEHLGTLLAQMKTAGVVAEEDFAIQLGHVFAHLNRAWHGRNDPHLDTASEELHADRSRYPTDLPSVG